MASFFDKIFRKATTISATPATPNRNLPLPQTMRGTSFFSGYQMQDLYANLSRRLPSSQRNWSSVCGDLMLNSVVAISIDFFVRAYSQAIPMVYTKSDSGDYMKEPNHPILELMANPQYALAPTRFWTNVIIDFKIYGNAYIRKIRNSASGDVIGLQFLPAQSMRPTGDNVNPIVVYEYIVDGSPYKINPSDVIHIAWGRDPEDYRLGRSPLTSVLREIATDNQASATAYGLMANAGLPSIMVSPDTKDDIVDVNDDDLRTLKKRLQDSFTGDQAGSIAIMSGPFKVEKISFSPNEMALDAIRHTPEERITSALGLNCLVLNLSAGLENSTYANLKEAERGAWNQGVIPLLKMFAESITQNLLGDYEQTKPGDYFDYDLSLVTALMADNSEVANRAEKLFSGGVIDRAEAKRMIGIKYDPTDEQYYHPESSYIIPSMNADPDTKSFKSAVPTISMKEEASRGLAWREEFGRGGTSVGINRAKQIIQGNEISDSDVLEIYSFLSRHQVDKKAEGFNPGEKGYPSNGRIAFSLWGGDAGYSWSKKERDKIMREREND
jgi:HK97 family phage portal protein